MRKKLLSYPMSLVVLAVLSGELTARTFQARCRLDIACDDKRTIREEFNKSYEASPKRGPGSNLTPLLTEVCTPLFGNDKAYCGGIEARCGQAGLVNGNTSCIVHGGLEGVVVQIRCGQQCSSPPQKQRVQNLPPGSSLMIMPR
ncbi:MAG: hypothetical protein HYR96_16150 [Deltaproteobacteria bacterium]|nr:hypothetical protein [Deltaproteobacteria bacterium]MBI3293199.1 hypothetical protein [Deltaproteobacteria bacterium]